MLKKAIFIFISLAAIPLHCLSQFPDTTTLSLVFAGDIMGHDEQISGAWDEEIQAYNYEPTFRYVRPFIEQADIAIGNLEVTLAGTPYSGYPQFSSPDELARASSAAGFDVMSVATNHIKNCAGASCEDDYNLAFLDTLDNLLANGIAPVTAALQSAGRVEDIGV
jgi:poly-gamma-glutamate synthesis protein (capsule biosynthesis protein)